METKNGLHKASPMGNDTDGDRSATDSLSDTAAANSAEQLVLDEHGLALENQLSKMGIDDPDIVAQLAQTKRPIFIATVEREVVNRLATLLDNNPHTKDKNFDIVVLGSDMFDNFYKNYLLNQMDIELQTKIRTIQTEEHYKDKTVATIMQLQYLLQKHFMSKDKKPLQVNFTESEFKSLLKKEGKNLSHIQVWEIIDMCLLFNLMCVTHETLDAKKHKKRYIITINPEDRLEYSKLLEESLKTAIKKDTNQLKSIQQTIKDINKEISQKTFTDATKRINKKQSVVNDEVARSMAKK